MKKLLLTLTLLMVASAQATTEADEQLFTAVERSSLAVTKAALKAGADVNTVRDDETPLSLAVSNGSLELVELLLEQGADCSFPEGSDKCGLITAINWEMHDLLDIMLEKSTIDLETLDRALFVAVDLIKYGVECEDCSELTITRLLQHGASPYVDFEYNGIAGTTKASAYDVAKQDGLTHLVQLFNDHTCPECIECECDDQCDS